MKTYKIKDDDKQIQPTKEQIQRNKDFKRFYANYEKATRRPRPLYKDPKLFFVLVLILLVVYLISREG